MDSETERTHMEGCDYCFKTGDLRNCPSWKRFLNEQIDRLEFLDELFRELQGEQ